MVSETGGDVLLISLTRKRSQKVLNDNIMRFNLLKLLKTLCFISISLPPSSYSSAAIDIIPVKSSNSAQLRV